MTVAWVFDFSSECQDSIEHGGRNGKWATCPGESSSSVTTRVTPNITASVSSTNTADARDTRRGSRAAWSAPAAAAMSDDSPASSTVTSGARVSVAAYLCMQHRVARWAMRVRGSEDQISESFKWKFDKHRQGTNNEVSSQQKKHVKKKAIQYRRVCTQAPGKKQQQRYKIATPA